VPVARHNQVGMNFIRKHQDMVPQTDLCNLFKFQLVPATVNRIVWVAKNQQSGIFCLPFKQFEINQAGVRIWELTDYKSIPCCDHALHCKTVDKPEAECYFYHLVL